MTDSEFKDAITFTERGDEYGLYRKVIARFSIGHEMIVSLNLMNFNDAMKQAKAIAVETLFRKVYEDRRKELAEAIYALHIAEPWKPGFHEQIDALMKLAKRQ